MSVCRHLYRKKLAQFMLREEQVEGFDEQVDGFDKKEETEEEDFSDLYVPSNSSEEFRVPELPLPADGPSARTRSKSSCSDRSEELFTRNSRLRQARRPLHRSLELLDQREDLGDAASRQSPN